ncbi:MAG: 3-oxoacyl-[acyl-carrier-protein] reductase [Deltaproteobacteria bacterium]|nr:3-oxoacyl-[acyl-carrier-protein] reductase [Deltaproteobacteria bacterium]
MSSDLSGSVALVTGGSRGIGRAIALKLASRGAHVYVNYTSRPDAAEEVVAKCRELGGSADALGFDVSSSEAVDQAIDEIKKRSSKLDILVNNAGISRDGLFIRMKDDEWQQTLAINLTGAFNCSRAAARLMMKARYGRIINISSVVGEMGNAGQVPYVSSKAGLIGMTKAVARELASRNVTVNAVTPGFIETDMTHVLDEKVKEQTLANIPLGRFGQADEVAELVLFLSQKESSYITGQVIGVNGGMHM